MTAEFGPICIDEGANHPARRKLIVESTLHREKAARAAEITESRIVILIDLSQNCPSRAIQRAWRASNTVSGEGGERGKEGRGGGRRGGEGGGGGGGGKHSSSVAYVLGGEICQHFA